MRLYFATWQSTDWPLFYDLIYTVPAPSVFFFFFGGGGGCFSFCFVFVFVFRSDSHARTIN